MRLTLALDDGLVAVARRLTGVNENSSLIREALKALIERETARANRRISAAPNRISKRRGSVAA